MVPLTEEIAFQDEFPSRLRADATRSGAGRFRLMGSDTGGFPLDRSAVHLCIDMQCLFAEPTRWQVAWMPLVLPAILEIARRHAQRTIFTRFIPPRSIDTATGAWADYYKKWPEMTGEEIDPHHLELVEPLAVLVPPARLIDKPKNSVFCHPYLASGLRARGITTLVVTGGETDVCVLATVMAAIDLGFRVILPTDALCSGNDKTHDALLTLYRERFSQQVETTSVDDVLRRWRRD